MKIQLDQDYKERRVTEYPPIQDFVDVWVKNDNKSTRRV